jgi:hypothetical protein
MGSQAFGAAQSYALKSFLRSIGLIATGDTEDADSHEQRDLPEVVRKKANQVRKDGEYPPIEAALRAAQTIEELHAIWVEHYDTIKSWPFGHRKLIEEEKERAKTRLEVE